MKRIYTILSFFMLTAALCMQLTAPASAANDPGFRDVSAESPWYEGISFAAENGITCGTGDNNFSPDAVITTRQWAVMICRAYDKEVPETPGIPFGQAQLELAYKEGWLNMSAVLEPDTEMCRSAIYASAFAAEGIPVYCYELYEDEEYMSDADNYVRIACENGLCAENADPLERITRGEAAQIIYLVRTKGLHVDPPEMVERLNINNVDQVYLGSYLVEMKKIPAAILDEYTAHGWSFDLDSQYLDDLSEQLNMQCAGATSYRQKTIYAREPSCTVHEFGHFYHQVIGFPSTTEKLYEKESGSARAVLGDYSTVNSREYFAEFFEYWIDWSENEDRMRPLADAAPETFAYFLKLEELGWPENANAQ